jgi:hypothetical protein
MILPKYSIRILLIAMVGIGVLSLVGRYAVQGQSWAIAMLLCALLVGMMFANYIFAFLIALVGSLLDAMFRPVSMPTTPFATNQPPAQVLPPRAPE